MIGPIRNPLWQEWAATALADGRLSWRVTDAQGRPCNGGNADPLPLGEWSPTIEDAVLCSRGWHTTSDPIRWRGSRVWLVEGDGLVGTETDKQCWRRIRPLAEVDPRQSVCKRIADGQRQEQCPTCGLWAVWMTSDGRRANGSGP